MATIDIKGTAVRTVDLGGEGEALVLAKRFDDQGGIVTEVLVPAGDGKTFLEAPRVFNGSGNGTIAVTDTRVAAWSAITSYKAGDRCRGPGDFVWLSQMDGNLGNPLAPGQWWRQLYRTWTQAEKDTERAAALATHEALTDEEIAAKATEALKHRV